MVVEWLRECYKSQWHLFKDSPATTTGQYYFAPPNAVAYPGVHNLGSRRWHDQNWEIVQTLGEDLTAKQLHLTGTFPGIVPEQVFVGSKDCLQYGEPIADDVDPATLFDGYPLECYIPPPAPPPPMPPVPPNQDYARFSSFTRCQVQRLWARVIDWMYLNDGASVVAALTAFAQSPATITFHAEEGDYPAVTTIVAPEYAVACMDGTRNAQQLAMMAFNTVAGVHNFGAFSTLPFWWAAAHYVNRKLEVAGVNDTRPIFLVGHSYGAIAALILAGLYQHWTPTRRIKYLTFGCPKIGDSRLADLLLRCDGWTIANSNDLVAALPPDRVTTFPLLPFFPLLGLGVFYDWERPPTVMTQRVDGSLTAGSLVGLDFQTYFTMLTRIVLAEEQEAIMGHSIGEYERRIILRCPDAGWPVTLPVLLLLEEEDVTDGGYVFAGMPGTYEGSGTLLFGGGDAPTSSQGGLLFGGSDVPLSQQGGFSFGG